MVPELYQAIIDNASKDLINFLDENLDKNVYNIKQDYNLTRTIYGSINIWESPDNSPTQISPR
jgi:hypothetical protein